jgi:hypothetical protein
MLHSEQLLYNLHLFYAPTTCNNNKTHDIISIKESHSYITCRCFHSLLHLRHYVTDNGFSCQKGLYLRFETVTNVFSVLFQLIKSKGLYSLNRGCLSYFILAYDK